MKNFKLKNYTTGISAEKSVMEIEQLLSAFGASHVMKEFAGDGGAKSIAFRLDEQSYKLPANVDGVKQALYGEKKASFRRNAGTNRDEQSCRVAWRIIRDWLHAQLSVIASGQAKPDEVMLPYLWDGKRTLYTAYKNGALQLSAPKEPSKDFNQNEENLNKDDL